MSKRFIPLCEPYITEDEIKAVSEVLRSKWLLQGPKVQEFERALEKFFNVKHAICVSSGTAALHLSVLSLNLGYVDRVLVPDFTFPATANAVIHGRGWPTFVDVDCLTFTIDPQLLEEIIMPQTKAIMPVHLFGHPANMTPILEVAEKHGLTVIEDAAGAFGAEYEGKKIGTFGNMTCFSFDTRKILTLGEGGVILTNDDDRADWLRMARSHGSNKETWKVHKSALLKDLSFPISGLNYRMSDIMAAIGLEQLKKLNWILFQRVTLANAYYEELSKVKGVLFPYVDSKTTFHTFQSYVITLDEVNNMRFIEGLRKRGVQASYGSRALHLEPCFKPYAETQSIKRFGVSEALAKRTVALPLYPAMTVDDVNYVCNQVEEVLVE